MMRQYSVALIGQSEFHGAGRSEDCRDDPSRNAFLSGAHSHHGNNVHCERKIIHGLGAHLIPRFSLEPYNLSH